jgi:hypothetical protein
MLNVNPNAAIAFVENVTPLFAPTTSVPDPAAAPLSAKTSTVTF